MHTNTESRFFLSNRVQFSYYIYARLARNSHFSFSQEITSINDKFHMENERKHDYFFFVFFFLPLLLPYFSSYICKNRNVFRVLGIHQQHTYTTNVCRFYIILFFFFVSILLLFSSFIGVYCT